jgi:L-ribulose-5-phosphate 4-epimerase
VIDEGYIKFAYEWQRSEAPTGIESLVAVRNELHRLGLVGIYEDSGIGYGNVSQRIGSSNQFVVSCSATGGIALATSSHFCIVETFDVRRNFLTCKGPQPASSESLTHAMLYASDPMIGAVLHIHHLRYWEYLLENGISSAKDIPYGTPEMAMEMERLLEESPLRMRKLLAMGGHSEGILAFGRTPEEAKEVILRGMCEKKW